MIGGPHLSLSLLLSRNKRVLPFFNEDVELLDIETDAHMLLYLFHQHGKRREKKKEL